MFRNVMAIVMISAIVCSQGAAQQTGKAPSYAQPAATQNATPAPDSRVANRQQRATSSSQPAASSAASQSPQAPFQPLAPAEQARLNQFLMAWQQQSQATRTLDCKFKRWHYDVNGAAINVHASKAEGVIRYAAPDKGLFRVDDIVFFQGQQEGKPQFKAIAGRFGEHWVCNGKQLIEMDRSNKKCTIQELPPEMQGQQIFNSPLPFVFNLDAQQILQRYWVRLVPIENPNIVMVEAWPKRQEDRAQYKLVQIGLDAKTFTPQALIMFAPNFDPKTAPNRDHYEFTDVKRNALTAGVQQFLHNFIVDRPPRDWKIVRNKYTPPAEPATAQAANPAKPR